MRTASLCLILVRKLKYLHQFGAIGGGNENGYNLLGMGRINGGF